mmetsp:Transcript_11412/g.32422  ORF Transcript_11412/g.32422 Transcript_11412/m.32422 type:complete len:218 (-) Transcript_11412:299-952(-)
MGQRMASLQSWNSTPPGSHAAPPWDAVSRTPRVRFLEPTWQVLEQSPQGSQLPQTQSTGHSKSLQTCWRAAGPSHMAPLPLCGVSMVRVLSRTPPPHVTLHSLLLHGLQAQSTSQAWRLHFNSSTGSPAHSAPPYISGVFKRFRCVQPPPQCLSQSLQPPQSCHSQFTGHGLNGHDRVSVPSSRLQVMSTPPEAYAFNVLFRCSTVTLQRQPLHSVH